MTGVTGVTGVAVLGAVTTVAVAAATTAAPAMLDLALPLDFGADVGGRTVDAGVTMSLVRPATSEFYGLVQVLVPLTAQGFTFAMSATVIQGAAPADLRVTLANGGPLPPWLRYVPARYPFAATNPPSNALPVDVLVRNGQQRWTITITAQELP